MKKALREKLDSIIRSQELIMQHLKVKMPAVAAKKSVSKRTRVAKAK